MADYKLIGKNYQTPDLVAKVTGKARYAEDYRAEGMLFTKLLPSPRPHARACPASTPAPRSPCRACMPFSLPTTCRRRQQRSVGADNCVRFEGLSLQIPADRYRCNYVKAKVRVHKYAYGNMAVFHGPRRLAHYAPDGKLLTQEVKQAA